MSVECTSRAAVYNKLATPRRMITPETLRDLTLRIWQALRRNAQALHDTDGQSECRVNLLVERAPLAATRTGEMPQQLQARDAEESVENIGHVAGPVRDAAVRSVLAPEDVVRQPRAVDPGRLLSERGAHVRTACV